MPTLGQLRAAAASAHMLTNLLLVSSSFLTLDL